MASGMMMYGMKAIYSNDPIQDALPTNMYKMKNFHANVEDDGVIECAELQELKHRQEAVLKDLEKLKAEICQISCGIGIEQDGSCSQVKVSSCVPVSNKEPLERPCEPLNMVVSASPNDPPLSLFLLQKIAQHRGLAKYSTATHIHSSLTMPLPECLRNIFGNSAVSDANICLRLIWKNLVLAPSLMISVVDQSLILGEANILRYLSRLFLPDLYSGLGSFQMANIDSWLTAVMKLTTSENGKDSRKTFVQTLNSHLGKHKWLVGSAPTLADIYCSIVLIKTSASSTFPNNVKKWISLCSEEFTGFQDIEKLCK